MFLALGKKQSSELPLSFADGPNLYFYVHNSPMILVDPYGLFGVDDVCFFFSSVGSSICDLFLGSISEKGKNHILDEETNGRGGASSVCR